MRKCGRICDLYDNVVEASWSRNNFNDVMFYSGHFRHVENPVSIFFSCTRWRIRFFWCVSNRAILLRRGLVRSDEAHVFVDLSSAGCCIYLFLLMAFFRCLHPPACRCHESYNRFYLCDSYLSNKSCWVCLLCQLVSDFSGKCILNGIVEGMAKATRWRITFFGLQSTAILTSSFL